MDHQQERLAAHPYLDEGADAGHGAELERDIGDLGGRGRCSLNRKARAGSAAPALSGLSRRGALLVQERDHVDAVDKVLALVQSGSG